MESTTKRVIKSLIISLIILSLLDLFVVPKDKPQKKNIITIKSTIKVYPIKELTLAMVGDGLIHSALYYDAYENGTYNFYKKLELIKPIIKEYDLAYYNQESILGGTSIGLSTYPRFNSPQEFGDAMIDCGFNLVSLANNHTLDRGAEAIERSRNYWNSKNNIMVNGSATSEDERNNIQIMEKNEIKYTLLSYTTTTNGISSPNNYFVNVYNENTVKEDIAKVRNKVDLLMVAMHWGTEYNTGVTESQKKIAQFLSEQGVDIIIGAHPHVIEPVEYIGNTLVIYSLGNFISAQRTDDQLSGLLMTVKVRKVFDIEKQDFVVKIEEPEARFTYTYRKNVQNYKVYPYGLVTTDLFPNKYNMYEILKKRVTSMDSRIKVKPIN